MDITFLLFFLKVTNTFFVIVHVHYVHWIREIAEANLSMYYSYSLDLDLVHEATGHPLGRVLSYDLQAGHSIYMMLKHTFAF